MCDSECAALVIHHSKQIRHIVFRGLHRCAASFLIISWTEWFKKESEQEMCVLIYSTNFICNISHAKKKWGRYKKNFIVLHVKYPLICSDFLWNFNFLIVLRKIFNSQISWKSVKWKLNFSMRKTDWKPDMMLILPFTVLRTRLKTVLPLSKKKLTKNSEERRNVFCDYFKNISDNKTWRQCHSAYSVFLFSYIFPD